jgi:CelD/BcsL family acetyltransferase involved in cellulose biosynthesis
MTMRIRVIRDLAEFARLERDWTCLISDSPYTAPYYSWQWSQIAWRAFCGDQNGSKQRTLHIVVVEDATGRTLAIAPFMREMTRLRGLPIRQLAFTPDLAPRRSFLFRNGVSKSEAVAAIAEHLAACRNQWDMMTLIGLEEDAANLALIEEGLRASNLPVVRLDAFNTPYIDIGDDFQKFLRESLSRSRRQSVGRKVRRLCEQNFRIVEFTKPEEMPNAIAMFLEVCRASWKAKAGVDITSSAARTQFFSEIAGHYASEGRTRIWLAVLDEQPIAVELHVTDGNKLYFMETDFAQSHEKLSPGTVLLYKVLEQIHSEPVEEFDFGGRTFDYKLKWATGVRKHYSIEVYNRRFYSRLLYQAKNRLMPALRKMFARKTAELPTEVHGEDDE